MNNSPKVFISYSHESDEHSEWVYQFACDLVENGVDAILDQWALKLGSNLHRFMEKGLTESHRVLVICTDTYNAKSNEGAGGVGYEKNILTAELMSDQDSTKFIPCVRNVTGNTKTPKCLLAQNYIDFSNDSKYNDNISVLVHALFDIPLRPKPELGFTPFEVESLESQHYTYIGDTRAFFARKFGDAFPGLRSTQWFEDPKEAIQRLKILLSDPLDMEGSYPLWWWREGNYHIESFLCIGDNTILINDIELKVNRIAAVHSISYYRLFVYVECSPSQPSGLTDEVVLKEKFQSRGYSSEVVGLFRGKYYPIEQFEDGSIIVDGEIIKLNGEGEHRIRYLTPYNFIIAAQFHPINFKNNHMRDTFNGLLNGSLTIEDLIFELNKLPKHF